MNAQNQVKPADFSALIAKMRGHLPADIYASSDEQLLKAEKKFGKEVAFQAVKNAILNRRNAVANKGQKVVVVLTDTDVMLANGLSVEQWAGLPAVAKASLHTAAKTKAKSDGKRGVQKVQIGEKGGVSIYFGGRFPITPYAEDIVDLLLTPGNVDKVLNLVASDFGKTTFKTRERAMATADLLRLSGREVSEASLASVRIADET